MPPDHLHVIGIDPGERTGWVRLTVPRDSIYGTEPGSFLDLDTGIWQGTPEQQTLAICRHARGVQSLDYPVGPALLLRNSSGRADELDAMIRYAQYRGDLGKEMLPPLLVPAHFTVSDEDLIALDLYDEYDPGSRDAMRTALAWLREAKANPRMRGEAWAPVPG